ncbi:MAG TPA: hypothetical protein VFU09_03675 [Candidatus Udaeobacter sp.]|nr:hypothetical protein [Candidatus Udaeobacter sp.]
MKRTIVTLTCVLITLLAFAQTGSNGKKQGGTSTESVTVTGTIITMTSEGGTAASYQPIKTLVVREDGSNNSSRYVLNGPGHIVNKAGEVIQTAIKPGTRVSVYYVNTGDSRVVDHVVVD